MFHESIIIQVLFTDLNVCKLEKLCKYVDRRSLYSASIVRLDVSVSIL